jgi:hypothetical protein
MLDLHFGPPSATYPKATLRKAANVEPKLDIFKRLPDGHPIWVKAVEGLEEAKRQLAQMANDTPGNYFIFNSRSGLILLD